MKSKIRAGIIGGAGYTGGETLRLLLLHPQAEVVFVHSKSQAGKPVISVHHDCLGLTNLNFANKISKNIDVLFLCLGHGESKVFLQSTKIPASVRIIDLSQDFRHTQNAVLGKRKFVYGLPELNRKAIQQAENIANPGCFATCIQLALLPLAANNQLHSEVHVSATTGSTGAGQSLSETSHFSWRQNNLEPYKVFEHQHLTEINESLIQLQPQTPKGALNSATQSPFRSLGQESRINFVPYRGAFTRGILATTYLDALLSEKQITDMFKSYYTPHPFVQITPFDVDLKQVVNTNNCFLQLRKKNGKAVIISAIDNLLKGASGQAVQNMNLMFGIDETTGLKLKPSAF
jgi:N-acetyl-gamma-glutamyl-phosphate reductase